MAQSTSGSIVAGRSENTDPQSKRGMGKKDLRGADKECGVGVMSAGAGGVVTGSVGVRICRRAGDGNDRAAWGQTISAPTMASASSEPRCSNWRVVASVAGSSCACEACVEGELRVEACSLAAAERSRRLLWTRATGTFVGV
jgi:hypothetical protein